MSGTAGLAGTVPGKGDESLRSLRKTTHKSGGWTVKQEDPEREPRNPRPAGWGGCQNSGLLRSPKEPGTQKQGPSHMTCDGPCSHPGRGQAYYAATAAWRPSRVGMPGDGRGAVVGAGERAPVAVGRGADVVGHGAVDGRAEGVERPGVQVRDPQGDDGRRVLDAFPVRVQHDLAGGPGRPGAGFPDAVRRGDEP